MNDFKSIKGDKELGIDSIPVVYGVDAATRISATATTLPQLGVALFLYSIGESTYAVTLVSLIGVQMYFAFSLLSDPVKNQMKYMASSQPFFVLSILVTALCIGRHDWIV